jgi:hypothetical protein
VRGRLPVFGSAHHQFADHTRIQAAQADADRHGYHIAYANPLAAEEEESWGGFLCYGSWAADSAEAGAEIIRRHGELGEPWPEELLRPA